MATAVTSAAMASPALWIEFIGLVSIAGRPAWLRQDRRGVGVRE
jgi:hypothetical protein